MTCRRLAFLTTTLFLLSTGALASLVVAVLGLALDPALQSLLNSDGFLLISVLAVSAVAAPDGLMAGLLTAAAISVGLTPIGLCPWCQIHAVEKMRLQRYVFQCKIG